MKQTQKISQLISQSQQLNITQSMQQSIAILQMNNFELEEFINQKIYENPLLIKKEIENNNFSYANNNYYIPKNNNYEFSIEQVESKKTLQEVIKEQIYISFKNKNHQLIAILLNDMIDEKGYLSKNKIELFTKQSDAKEKDILYVIKELKKLEPTGIFSENLEECLSTQLKDKNIYDEYYKKIIDNLKLLANNNITKLSTITGLDYNDLISRVKIIKSLNPKPANLYTQEETIYKTPDIIMLRNEQEWKIIHHNNIYNIEVDKESYKLIKNNCKKNTDTIKNISELYKSANNIVNSIEQRNKTIEKVSYAIIQQQIDFFENGIYYLKPLNLKKIAEQVGLHESTISRVCNNKNILTPYGILPLKYFMAKASNDNQTNSTKDIELRILNIIKNENPKKPLSDQEISNFLKDQNIIIARRTISKYRNILKIPSTNLRKKII